MYGLLGSSASVALRHWSHYISFITNAILLTALCIYMWYGRRWRDRYVESVNGPLTLSIVASLLILADPIRHVLQHWNIWKAPSSSQYRWDCEAGVESFVCLSVVGWMFTVIFTYMGFTLLLVATCWNARICEKCARIRRQWKQIRRTDVENVYDVDGLYDASPNSAGAFASSTPHANFPAAGSTNAVTSTIPDATILTTDGHVSSDDDENDLDLDLDIDDDDLNIDDVADGVAAKPITHANNRFTP